MKLIDTILFDNGISLKLVDMSRKIAADRWLVELVCEISFPLPDKYATKNGEESQKLYQAFFEDKGGVLRHAIVKRRYFIDQQDRDRIFAELVMQWNESAHEYLKNQAFPARMLAREIEKFKLDYRSREQTRPEEVEDDEGPVDFSGCFRDPIDT